MTGDVSVPFTSVSTDWCYNSCGNRRWQPVTLIDMWTFGSLSSFIAVYGQVTQDNVIGRSLPGQVNPVGP